MRDTTEPALGTLAVHLLVAYVLGGYLLALPLLWGASGQDFPELPPYAGAAAGVSGLLAIAVRQRSSRFAIGAAAVSPILAAVLWRLYDTRSNRELQDLAAGGDPGAIALVLHGHEQGWLAHLGAPMVTGAAAALLYALYWIWRLQREDDAA